MIGLDSTFIIDHFKKDPGTKLLLSKDEIFVICEPIIFEFMCGNISETTKKAVEEFALPLTSFTVDRNAVKKAAKIFRDHKKQGKSIGTFDALIAGTYFANGVTQIATRNIKHFTHIKELRIVTY